MNLAHLNCVWIQMRILRCVCMDCKWKRSNDKIMLKNIFFLCMFRLYITRSDSLERACVCMLFSSYYLILIIVSHRFFSLMCGMWTTTMALWEETVREKRSDRVCASEIEIELKHDHDAYTYNYIYTWTTSPRDVSFDRLI